LLAHSSSLFLPNGYNSTMDTLNCRLERFFAEYEARFNRALGENPEEDVEATAAAFADSFIGANPNGVLCGENNEQLRSVFAQSNAFYRSIGTESMRIAGLEITSLDDFHAMAKVHWDSRYVKKDGQHLQIEFDVIYLIQILGGTPKIFGYITGDESKVLKEYGLLPG
jgi:hypothetical protein